MEPRRQLRNWVLQRDNAICAFCGCNALKLSRVMVRTAMALQELNLPSWWSSYREILKMMGLPIYPERASFWEADHITPLGEGGTDTLDNMRTLCIPCHKAESARGAKRRAKTIRRRAKQPKRKYDAHHLSRIRDKI